MKTFTTALVAGFAALAQAVSLTNSDFTVKAGQPFTITWTDAQGPVTLTLKNGLSTDLKTVAPITSGATGTSFTWTPSSSLPSDTYAIEISDGTDVNYSTQFPVVGASGSASASASASASGSGSATATASASASDSASDSASASASASASSSASASASVSATATLTITSSASETASETAATVSAASNSTIASTVSTSARSTLVSSATSGSTTAPTTVPGSDAGRIGSPIALIGLAVAAMLYIQ